MRKFKASVSLTTVLVTTAVLLAGSISVLFNIIDMTRTNKDNLMYELNSIRADSCLEESMNKLKFNPNYTGDVSITFIDGSCISNITIDPLNIIIRDLHITSTIDEYHYEMYKKVDISQTPFYVYN